MADSNRQYWNSQFKILQSTWPKPLDFLKNIEICLELHAMVHSAAMCRPASWSFEDELWQNLPEEAFRRIHRDEQSIAWKLWHAGRIEDITMNLLIAGKEQVFNSGGWPDKLKIAVPDTGNGMSEEEIREFSDRIDMKALKRYRDEVGQRTRSIIKALRPADLKRKADKEGLRRIVEEKAVSETALWLLEYWGGKTVAGLLLMPATRHNLVHLNESMRIKQRRT